MSVIEEIKQRIDIVEVASSWLLNDNSAFNFSFLKLISSFSLDSLIVLSLLLTL